MYGIVFAILFIILAINIFSSSKCRNCGRRCYTSRAVKDKENNTFCTKKCGREYYAKNG